MNSVGIIPLDYLNNTDHYKALVAFANAKQVLSQYLVKEASKRQTELFFQSFEPLSHVKEWTTNISNLIDQNKIQEAETQSIKLIKLCLEGLNYYQKYDWFFLRTIVSFGYLGWIFYSLEHILAFFVIKKTKKQLKTVKNGMNLNGIALIIFACMSLLLKLVHFYSFLY